MRGEILQIRISVRSSQKTENGSVCVQVLGPADRVKDALRALGLYWGIALFCVLFPLLHFVLVPFFLLLGIFLAVRAGLAKERILDGSVLCPECKKPFSVKPALVHWPMNEVCQECRWSFVLIPDSHR